jgi:cyclophilin family peptidyl-prolyl cis-trans isomerase/HEAT repeat protein
MLVPTATFALQPGQFRALSSRGLEAARILHYACGMGNLPRSLFCCAVLALAGLGCRTSRALSAADRADLNRIRAWEDARSLGGGGLVSLATTPAHPEVRARALVALGRLQEPGTAAAVSVALRDPEPRVRAAAAFAAGLLGFSWVPLPDAPKQALVQGVLQAEASESDAAAHLQQLIALGRLVAPETSARLEERLGAKDAVVRAEAALGLGVTPRRGGKVPDTALGTLATLAAAPEENVRYAAAYALAASKSPAARPALLQCLKDASVDTRALCAKGLAETAQQDDVPALSDALGDAEPRVAAEAVRVLGRLVERCAAGACPALDALANRMPAQVTALEKGDAARGHVVLALAQQGLPARGAPVLELVRMQLHAVQARAAAPLPLLGNLDCRLAAAQDRLAGLLFNSQTCGDGQVPLGQRLAFGMREVARGSPSAPDDLWKQVAPYLDSSEPPLRLAAVELAGALKPKAAMEKVRGLISSPDEVLAAGAADAAAKLGDTLAVPAILTLAERVPKIPDLAEPVADALVTLKAPGVEALLRGWLAVPHAHVRLTAAKLLSKLTGAPVAAPSVEAPAPAERVAPAGARVTFDTGWGPIVVALDTESTPLTSGNLYQLAKAGFFDGLTFHRIVPDFVVQGGDPRGDGNGGPGYTLPCEVSERRYRRGTVGMALSGKDTGGSQFFVTSSPQPHLEGRYTAFGEVVSGMEVVDRLLEGDRIRSARVEP